MTTPQYSLATVADSQSDDRTLPCLALVGGASAIYPLARQRGPRCEFLPDPASDHELDALLARLAWRQRDTATISALCDQLDALHLELNAEQEESVALAARLTHEIQAV